MKYFILVPDGAADYPIDEFGGKTALEAAKIPTLDKLTQKSISGTVKTIPDNLEPGSDIASLSILGYDPNKYFNGRGPLEAAYRNIKVDKDETIFRCNLVTVKDGLLVDYSAGHIETEKAAELIGYLDKIIKGVSLYPGVSYRHLAAMKGNYSKTMFFAPHDVIGKQLEEIYPRGEGKEKIIEIYKESNALLESNEINEFRIAEGKNPANMIWFWSGGKDAPMHSFENIYNKKGAMISAVDLLKGIAKKIKMEVIEVEGATGYLDTNYAGKVDAAIKASKNSDVVMIHVEAPDEAGHSGDPELKIRALEDFDEKVVAALFKKLGNKHFKFLIMPDHYTPLSVKTHTRESVPFIVYDSKKMNKSGAKSFSEKELEKGESINKGHELLKRTLFK